MRFAVRGREAWSWFAMGLLAALPPAANASGDRGIDAERVAAGGGNFIRRASLVA